MSLFAELDWRGLVQQATEGAREALDGPPIRVYIGFDPTGRSLHVGSLLPLTMLVRLQRAGHQALALLGGGTGMIGDPSGKSAERSLLTADQVAANLAGIRSQVETFLKNHAGDGAQVVDNAEWLARLSLIEFLRDVGKCFTVNYMLGKESVRRRVESEQGISYTEFSYLILQSYDYLHLHDTRGVTCQMGATDQWGNITAGIDLIRSQRGHRVHGLVHPLVTKPDGTKFGKTESGAVWLDPQLTSPFRFYQFWINTPDSDVIRFLKYFTFLPRAEIEEIERAHAAAPETREAHARLASELTRMIHGEEALTRAQRATRVFFGAELEDLNAAEVLDVFGDVPAAEVPRTRLLDNAGLALIDLLVEAGVSPSKGEARRAIEAGGLYLNNRRIVDSKAVVTSGDLIEGRLLVLRKGKKNYHLVRVAEG